jgi:hypothetical protein
MPHIFPPRKFVDGEVADPVKIVEITQPLVAKLTGRLNEHDVYAATGGTNTFPYAKLDGSVYYGVEQVSDSVDPDFTDAAAAGYPWATPNQANCWTLLDEPAWAVVDNDTSPGHSLTVTLSTGEDKLAIFAQIQYAAWFGDATGAFAKTAPSASNPLRIQFAIRVDGAVIEETITGAALWPDPAPQPFYRVEAENTTNEYDFRQIRYVQNAAGLSSALRSVRLTWAMPVMEGSHTVEVVARRIPQSDGKTEENGSGVVVQALNRWINVLQVKGHAKGDGTAPSLAVSALEDGETATLANLFTSRLYAIRDTVNDLDASALERGALRHEHLASVVASADAKAITPNSSVPVGGTYPGFGTSSAQWQVVNDGVGANLEITNGGSGWDVSAGNGFLVVMANVQLYRINWSAAPSTDVRAIGCFALAYTDQGGTRNIPRVAEVYFNGHHPDASGINNDIRPIEDDVPLMYVVSFADLRTLGVTSISKIEAVASKWDGAAGVSPAPVEVRTKYGSLYAFLLKGVT